MLNVFTVGFIAGTAPLAVDPLDCEFLVLVQDVEFTEKFVVDYLQCAPLLNRFLSCRFVSSMVLMSFCPSLIRNSSETMR